MPIVNIGVAGTAVYVTNEEIELAKMAIEDYPDAIQSDVHVSAMRALRDCTGMSLLRARVAIILAKKAMQSTVTQ